MNIEEKLKRWVEAYDRNGYLNGSILVAANGEILLNKGFGFASFEHQVPNSSTTKFRIGSLTKAFTAMSILQLYEKQKLDLHDTIDKYLPNYPHGDRITIYHCLTNTSGIANYTSFPDFWFRTMRLPATLEQLIDTFKDEELEFEPGTEFSYSNSAYAILTFVIQSVSGMSYAEYIQDHICQPLGLNDTGCDDGAMVVPSLATGYSFWEKPIHAAFADMSFPLGAYGLYSTVEDLYKWDQALAGSQLLSKQLMELMFTPLYNSYACGWMVSHDNGKKCVHHFGDVSGYYSDFLRFVDDQLTIIFLSNMSITPVTHLTRELAKIAFGQSVLLPIPADPIELTTFDSIIGTYTACDKPEKYVVISAKSDELYLTVAKMYGVPYKFKLVPVNHSSSLSVFVTETIHEQLEFKYSDAGEIESLRYTDYYGKVYIMKKGSTFS